MKKNFCLENDCSACCDPVKINRKLGVNIEKEKLPFRKRREVFVPEEHPETIKLDVYDCELFDKSKKNCADYEKRPQICRQTECAAFKTKDKEAQKEIIKKIKDEKFFVLR